MDRNWLGVAGGVGAKTLGLGVAGELRSKPWVPELPVESSSFLRDWSALAVILLPAPVMLTDRLAEAALPALGARPLLEFKLKEPALTASDEPAAWEAAPERVSVPAPVLVTAPEKASAAE